MVTCPTPTPTPQFHSFIHAVHVEIGHCNWFALFVRKPRLGNSNEEGATAKGKRGGGAIIQPFSPLLFSPPRHPRINVIQDQLVGHGPSGSIRQIRAHN